jgi:hypothetical protein
VADAEQEVLRAQRRAADQLGKLLGRGRRPTRSVHIPVLQPDPPFSSGINLWLDPAGNLRSYGPDGTKYQYTKTTVTANSGSFPADPQPETKQTIYDAQWAATYCDTHGLETGTPGLWYGDDRDGLHLGRKLMIGLPDATIRSDTAGGVIEKVDITATNLDAYADSVSLHWGLHNVTGSAPATYSAVRKDGYIGTWPKVGFDASSGGTRYRNVHVGFGTMLRDNTAKGFTIDQPGGWGGAGILDWTSVKIRITYTV